MTKTSQLEYALLALVKQEPRSGYDLRKLFATTPMRHFSDSPGSIYPALRRLHARKWLSGSAETASARKREEFRITKTGDRALQEWLRRGVTREDVVWGLDEIILRFAFLDGNVERAVTLNFLEDMERELSAYTAELRDHMKGMPSGPPHTATLAFEQGIEGYEAQLEWARRIRKLLAEAQQ